MTQPHTQDVAEIAGIRSPSFDAMGNPNYDPCHCGLHLCGRAGVPEQPYTAANLPARSHNQARGMWLAAKAVAECAKDDADYLVDLNLGCARSGVEHVDDFYTNRQLWPRAVDGVRAYLLSQSDGGERG